MAHRNPVRWGAEGSAAYTGIQGWDAVDWIGSVRRCYILLTTTNSNIYDCKILFYLIKYSQSSSGQKEAASYYW